MGTTLSAWRRAGRPGPLDGGQADTQDAPGSVCSWGGAWPAWAGCRAQGVHTLSFCPSQTRRDTAPSSSVLTEGRPPPGALCALLPAAPQPRPRPFLSCWALLAMWALRAACSATGVSPQGRGAPRAEDPPHPRAEETPGRRAVVLALDGRTCHTASACERDSGAWTGVPGDAGSRGRAACCPSAPGRPQGLCLPGGLLSTTPPRPVTSTLPPQPTPTPNSPHLKCICSPPASLLKGHCLEKTVVTVSHVSGSAPPVRSPGPRAESRLSQRLPPVATCSSTAAESSKPGP